MIQIERLRMRLPAGFEHRATTIARLVGDILAQQTVPHDASMESISITSQRVNANTPDAEVAQLIAVKIIAGYEGRR